MTLFLFLAFACCAGALKRGPRPINHLSVWKEEQFHQRAKQQQESRARAIVKYPNAPLVFFIYQPVYSCMDTMRIGGVDDDGGKYVCNVQHLREQRKCVIYSFGINNDIEFDVEARRLLPKCEIHGFDPTPGVTEGTIQAFEEIGVFHKWGVSDKDGPMQIAGKEYAGFSFSTIVNKLGHNKRAIDVVKMDIEGSEFSVLSQMLDGCDAEDPLFLQLLLEIHLWDSGRPLNNLMSLLEGCGYRLFSMDPNFLCPNCMEYAFVHPDFLHYHR